MPLGMYRTTQERMRRGEPTIAADRRRRLRFTVTRTDERGLHQGITLPGSVRNGHRRHCRNRVDPGSKS